jgi:hypothetical protein
VYGRSGKAWYYINCTEVFESDNLPRVRITLQSTGHTAVWHSVAVEWRKHRHGYERNTNEVMGLWIQQGIVEIRE